MFTISCVFLGICTVIGAGFSMYNSYKDQEALKQQLPKDIQIIKNKIVVFKTIKTSINQSKNYLIESRNYFKNGGYVYDEVPLGNDIYEQIFSNISEYSKEIDKAISELSKEQTKLENILKSLS